MKRTTIVQALAITVAAAPALGIALNAQAGDKECSNATLKGPFAIVGAQTFDGNGALTATATVSQNGNIIPVSLAGIYTVQAIQTDPGVVVTGIARRQ